MSRGKATRSLYLILGASTLAIASHAQAQTPAQESARSDFGLAEIVVTAQKRAENLQDVPIAISAISSEKVEQLGIKDSRDISGLAPNVTVVPGTMSASAAVFSMRGISNGGSESFGVDAANGLYVDGVYIARSGAMGLDVMDIERVEVLRGPQGTLFGRNTTGGAIAFISRAPSDIFRLKAEAGYGNFNAWNGRISLDPGEIGGIATSFSYSHSQRHGVVDNILQSKDSRDPGARKSDSFRIAARTEMGGTGSIQYSFDWSKIRATPMPFQLTNIADGTQLPPIAVNGETIVVTQPTDVAAFFNEATFANPECAALGAPRREYRDRICNDVLSWSEDKSWGHNLQIQNDFGGFRIKATTGYRFWNSKGASDLDGIGAITGPSFTRATTLNGMPLSVLNLIPTLSDPQRAYFAGATIPSITSGFFDVDNDRRHKQLSQEIEISGDNDNLDWVVGGFYFWEKGSEDGYQNSGYVLDTNTAVFNQETFEGLAPLLVAGNPERYRLNRTLARLVYTTTSESTAIYAQTTFYPGGRDSGLRLTAGGRYTWDSKSMIRSQNGELPSDTLEQGRDHFKKFTWNLMAGYDIADGINAYARAATGYRSGGYNSQDKALDGTSTLPSFKPEHVTSYELGIKSELFNRRLRLNLAGYHNIYKDLVVNVPLTDGPQGTFATRIDNAGKVTYTGFEAEALAILSDNFSFEGSLGYIDIKYKEFLAGRSTVAGAPPVDISPIVTPGYTSPLTANAALNAQFPLSGNLTLRGRVSYTHEDGKYSFSTPNSVPFNEEIKGDDRDLVDAQISLEGFRIGTGEASFKLWVKNLTNSKDLVRGIDFGQLGIAGGFYADPRTYGASISLSF